MANDTTYIAQALHRSGYWDHALDILPAEATALRAQILSDRFLWRLGDPAEAMAAVADLSAQDSVLAQYYGAQLAYTRLLFAIDPRPGDRDLARDGFTAAAGDRRLAGWGTFWLGVHADHLEHDPDKARGFFTSALTSSLRDGDALLESYASRHLGGLDRLHRSYHLRAALGVRPQTAAAAFTLADALPEGPQADELKEMALTTARELQLTWLLAAQ